MRLGVLVLLTWFLVILRTPAVLCRAINGFARLVSQ
jgi:hypothetical protein